MARSRGGRVGRQLSVTAMHKGFLLLVGSSTAPVRARHLRRALCAHASCYLWPLWLRRS